MKISIFLYKYFNSFCVLVLITLLCFFEVRFNFAERMLGYYLYWQNDSRPKIGRMWEFHGKNIAALGSIEEVVSNLKKVKSKVINISDFRDLFLLIEKEDDLAISKSRFIALQKSLPSELSEIFFPPSDILSLFYSSTWDRTFFVKGNMEVEVLLVDSNNRVLKKTAVDEERINLIKSTGEIVKKSLDDIDEFKNRIYSASDFFSRLQNMDEYAKSKIIQDPGRFFEWGRKLKRVGISEYSRSGWIKIGYELESGLKKQTAIFELDEFAVYELMDQLNPRKDKYYSRYKDGDEHDIMEEVWDDQYRIHGKR